MASRIPNGALVSQASTSGTTAAVTASIGTTSGGGTVRIAGFSYQGSNATAAQNGVVAVTGIANTMNFAYPTLATAATTPQPPPLVVTFDPPIPATGTNTQISVAGPALGSGAPVCTINVWGYTL